jgi:Na+-transporting NADH:ubiquinone oxidoreductase subunit C
MQFSVRYIVLFSAAICIACAILVSSSAVTLHDMQQANQAEFKQKNVLEAAGLIEPGASVAPAEVEKLMARIRPRLVDLKSGELLSDADSEAAAFDQQKAKRDPTTSYLAAANPSRIKRIPNRAQIFEVLAEDGSVEMVVLPIEGYGLWSTLLGFIALDADLETVRGLTYYDHKETPGLGGEVDNPRWKKLWPGRRVFGSGGGVEVKVIKGAAGPAAEDPYRVDGLSGATITSRGVSNMLAYWLGPDGFGPFLEKYAPRIGAKEAA